MSTEDKNIRISEELANDPNFIAYNEAKNSGQFDELEPGTFVAFHEGKLVGTATDRDQLAESLLEKGIEGGYYYKQVNAPKTVHHVRGPRIVRN